MSDLVKLGKLQTDWMGTSFLPTHHGLQQTRDRGLDLAGLGPEAPPGIPAPVNMPMATDDQRAAARRRSIAQQIARRGRASTILTADDNAGEKLGD